VQLHAAIANFPVNRPTTNGDLVLHIEIGAETGPESSRALSQLG